MKFQAIKGVRDILPAESALWNRVEQTAREVFATYGYGEIRLPIFEDLDLFERSIGGETDIVSKEMYSFDLYAFAQLSHLRMALLSPPADNPIRFTGYLYELVQALKDAWESNRIEQTPSNGRIIEKLGEIYKTLYKEMEHDKVAFEAYKNPDIQKLTTEVDLLAEKISMQSQYVVLRPEATASVCRAYIEHGMHTLPGNVKLYYIGPMFRRERPQKGRYRQFYQIGAEVLGQSDAPAIDAEVIEMLMAFFERAGLRSAAVPAAHSEKSRQDAGGTEQGWRDAGATEQGRRDAGATGCTLYINSIGCKECRPKYVEKLRAALVEQINDLKADSQRRVETNPLRVLDSKLPEEQAVIEKLPRITEHLCDACREHYAEVKKQLALRGVAYQENWRLVRGLDYYMRTTFEITGPGLGAQNAVCGGGRYDGLVELLGGPATKGIGFAIGTDRLILSLQEAAKQQGAGPSTSLRASKEPALQALDVFIAWMGAAAQPAAVKMARTLREAGFSVEVPAEEMKFKKSIGLADKLGARYALIIGENEIAEGRYALKRLSDGVQEKVGADELVQKVKWN